MSSKISLWTGIIGVGTAISIFWLNVTIAPDNYVKSAAQKYFDKGDYRGALADYNQALTLDPRDAIIYLNRGLLKQDKLNDVQGAISDMQQAVTLFQQQGKQLEAQQTIELIKMWQVTSNNSSL